MIDVNKIIDDTFMDKCVSKLNFSKLYLFNIVDIDNDCLMLYWTRGTVLVGSVKDQDIIKTESYTKGYLKDYVFKLD